MTGSGDTMKHPVLQTRFIPAILVVIFLVLSGACVSKPDYGAVQPGLHDVQNGTITAVVTPSWYLIKNGSITIPQDDYHYFGWDLHNGQSVKFEVVTDGAPLDLTILDSRNFHNFQQSKGSETSVALKQYQGITVLQDVFTAGSSDAFFFVFDNFHDPGGSYARRDVTVNVTFYRDG